MTDPHSTISRAGYDAVFARRLIKQKNVDAFLDAFDAVTDDHDATVGIIGDGPERERLEAKHQIITHADHVEFLGFLEDYKDILVHMRAGDIFASRVLATTLKRAVDGERPLMNPVERAQRYDWDAVADQAETAYRCAIDGSW